MSELPTTHSELPFYYCCVDTAMPSLTQIVRRFGSAIIAVLLPFLALLIEQPIATLLDIHFEIVRAVVSVACIVLLIHSGLRQRAYSRDRWEFSFWIALLGVPLLGATWLGLNVIRYYLYPDYWTDNKVARWELVYTMQLWDQRAAVALTLAVAVWGVFVLLFRISRSPTHS